MSAFSRHEADLPQGRHLTIDLDHNLLALLQDGYDIELGVRNSETPPPVLDATALWVNIYPSPSAPGRVPFLVFASMVTVSVLILLFPTPRLRLPWFPTSPAASLPTTATETRILPFATVLPSLLRRHADLVLSPVVLERTYRDLSGWASLPPDPQQEDRSPLWSGPLISNLVAQLNRTLCTEAFELLRGLGEANDGEKSSGIFEYLQRKCEAAGTSLDAAAKLKPRLDTIKNLKDALHSRVQKLMLVLQKLQQQIDDGEAAWNVPPPLQQLRLPGQNPSQPVLRDNSWIRFLSSAISSFKLLVPKTRSTPASKSSSSSPASNLDLQIAKALHRSFGLPDNTFSPYWRPNFSHLNCTPSATDNHRVDGGSLYHAISCFRNHLSTGIRHYEVVHGQVQNLLRSIVGPLSGQEYLGPGDSLWIELAELHRCAAYAKVHILSADFLLMVYLELEHIRLGQAVRLQRLIENGLLDHGANSSIVIKYEAPLPGALLADVREAFAGFERTVDHLVLIERQLEDSDYERALEDLLGYLKGKTAQ